MQVILILLIILILMLAGKAYQMYSKHLADRAYMPYYAWMKKRKI